MNIYIEKNVGVLYLIFINNKLSQFDKLSLKNLSETDAKSFRIDQVLN